MTDIEQRLAARQFVKDWTGRGDEKQETQVFWISLLQNVFGVEQPTAAIEFEVRVKLDHTSFIDGYIKDTHVLIEQKGMDIDLRKGYKQSDGSMLTPFQQARRYAGYLPHDMNPRWIVVCNFKEFHLHDMNRPNDTPEVIKLEELETEYHRLQFLVDTGSERIKKEMQISLQAGELVGKLYDALLKQYNSPASEDELKSLNMLCVRLVFCLYAEDAGIFGGHNMFHDYLKGFQPKNVRKALMELFKVLDTKVADRDPYMDEDLAAFPYVNGGLFADENIIVPRFTEEIVELLLSKASEDFNWSDISPTIFGAVFESTLNPDTRRSGGMHYTSIENIHKVIDPLFLNDLTAELDTIAAIAVKKTRDNKLADFQKKIASLTFLDPACGSGNFLTETYLALRRLENRAVMLRLGDQIILGDSADFNPIQVSIGQFYGIEINDFAVTVAKTALWIAESQMMKETEEIVRMHLDFLPLTSYANIVEGNALRVDWESVVPKDKLNYIMGNPPFVGKKEQTKSQKDDIVRLMGADTKKAGSLDYVSGWYAYYLFQDEKSISQPKSKMSGVDLEGKEIRAFAYDMGRIIGSISDGLTSVSDFIVADVNMENIHLCSQDFNTNRCRPDNGVYKIIRLFLLHVLSSVGFLLFVLKKIIIRDSGLLLRLEYITYHYALIRLDGILKHCKSKMLDTDSKLIEMLESIDYINSNGLRTTAFRNCMMHFGLRDTQGNPLITEDKFDLSLPFCGLVETQFNLSYAEYKEKIETELIALYTKIRDYLDFELLLDADQ